MKQILLLSLLLPMTCFGRLGETKEQLDARYGTPVKTEVFVEGIFTYTYVKSGYSFGFTLFDGKAETMNIRKEDGRLSDEEINLFLTKNALNSGFELIKTENVWTKIYAEKTSGRMAYFQELPNILTIFTPKGFKLYSKRSETELKQKTDGF